LRENLLHTLPIYDMCKKASYVTLRGLVMIRHIIMVFFVCLVFAMVPLQQVSAKGLYVRDWITISVRTTPQETARMVGLANTNDFLEVIEEQEEWTKVRTPDGKDGWVQNRYLTKLTPKALIIDQLNEKVKSLTENNKTLREENKQLQKDNRERNYKMSSLSKEVDKVKNEYDDLKTSSAEYLELKKSYEDLQGEFVAHSEKMEILAKENNRLKTSDRLIFTLIGGGFIIVGLVLGVILQLFRSRPKKAGYKF
jgi:SH3 domain protein